MKNKILSYLFGGLLVLSLSLPLWYVYAQGDPCSKCSSISDPEENYKCLAECAQEQTEWKNKKECKDWCCWIKLNTDFPIIWNCIWGDKEDGVDATNAFPTMLGAFTKIIMSVILVVCFVMVIYAGILRSANNPKEAKEWLTRVAITVALLWLSGVILKLINPNFFG